MSLLRTCLPLLVMYVVSAKPKTPMVLWGQKPDKLYVSIALKDISDKKINLEEKRIYFSGVSSGQEYEADMKLLRGINVTSSKYETGEKAVNFELVKLADEPCWKRMLKTKKPTPWLKKDTTRLYPNECHEKQIVWREAYFYAKLHPEEAAKQAEAAAAGEKDSGKAAMDREREQKEETYQRKVDALRAKAVPRKTKGKKKQKATKGKAEL
eukprot:TRINITY_DN61797_c0_g1_i1.p1 TRINITY_DN61797_c0_g1~~TRINITY_DN61797_c0_g1_i1.p1  ORF type:complete len:211 (+),score=71.54 TRINITY_DN61797_c0_g1_i1:26-658(+)